MPKQIIKSKCLGLAGLLLITVACSPTSESDVDTNEQQELPVETVSVSDTVEPTVAEAELDKRSLEATVKLQWVQLFNVNEEVKKAVDQKDFRLMVIAKRGPNVPGIELEKQTMLKQKCGEKNIQGLGDVLLSEQHKFLYDKAIELAAEYNKVISDKCESRVV